MASSGAEDKDLAEGDLQSRLSDGSTDGLATPQIGGDGVGSVSLPTGPPAPIQQISPSDMLQQILPIGPPAPIQQISATDVPAPETQEVSGVRDVLDERDVSAAWAIGVSVTSVAVAATSEQVAATSGPSITSAVAAAEPVHVPLTELQKQGMSITAIVQHANSPADTPLNIG